MTTPALQHKAVNEQIPFYPTPTWDVALYRGQGPIPNSYAITLGTGRNEYIYPGNPDGAVAHFGCIGFTVPADILDRYRRLFKNQGPIFPQVFGNNRKIANELDFLRQRQKEAVIERELAPIPTSSGTYGVPSTELPAFPTKDNDGKYL